MKFMRHFFYLAFVTATLFSLSSCSRSREDVWDDSASCYRHVSRGFRSLCGMPSCNSRQVRSREEFYCPDDDGCTTYTLEPQDVEYSSSYSYDQGGYSDELAMADYVARPPKDSPGDPDSPIPGIDAFKDPSRDRNLRGVFQSITFPYNSNLVKGSDNLGALNSISTYMKSHPNTYIFVEGHCDERGADAYNLSLGARRANAVRNLLIENGVNSDNIFTVSYGRERPLNPNHNEDAWAMNRRAEFKVYER